MASPHDVAPGGDARRVGSSDTWRGGGGLVGAISCAVAITPFSLRVRLPETPGCAPARKTDRMGTDCRAAS
jgi:hypothetical protein